ncbi:MAG: stage V sporulation protein AB [Eubacteriales bacterium]|nr:stage V sporulation protein AB [Eubacteriales bacterium]
MNILLAIIGLASGFAVASGVFALVTILGIIPRLCDRLGLATDTHLMETIITVGGTVGSIITIFRISMPFGICFLAVIGLFAGIYIGSLAMALAETLKVVPILCQRTNLKLGIAVIITAIALGKGFGTFYQLFLMGGQG